jgi:major membrane immunogen (membrane-anchored lipoprotein)
MNNQIFKTLTILVLGALILLQTSCSKDDENSTPKPDVNYYTLEDGNRIKQYNAQDPATAKQTMTVTGLKSNTEVITSIDFRPATGEMYGISSSNYIYVINSATGQARAINSAPLSTAIEGNAVSLDFNPTVDRIRIVTNTGQNLRLHPETGVVVATDGKINGADVNIEAVAYTNSVSGATSTVLLDIDQKTDKLYKQDPPNNGTLVEVGGLGVDITAAAGFDIKYDGSIALCLLMINNVWELRQIDISTGATTKIGDVPAGSYKALAIPTAPISYAVDDNNNLVYINFEATASTTSKPITGLATGESIVGLDFRPFNGQLYAISSASKMYTINLGSGAATQVGSAPLTSLLVGTSFGFDFNPTVDRIRLVSNTGLNLRLHPETGLVAAVDGILNPGTPSICASAYTNNFAGATSTVLFNIDSNDDMLYKQDPPNSGGLVAVGKLGVNVESAAGFDIGSQTGSAYAALKVGSQTSLYTISLTTGVATKIQDLSFNVNAFTVGTGF